MRHRCCSDGGRGPDKVIVGIPGEDVKAPNDGGAYLFDTNGGSLDTDGVVDSVDLFVVLEHVGHCVDP